MIYIDENDPDGTIEAKFPARDVVINRGVDAKELYELIKEVGRGKFGTVYKCREKATGLDLAAKFVPIPKREDRRNVEREVEIMNSLQHHLIIQLYAAYEYQKMMCVVLELVEGGELFDRVIDDDFILTERACTVFIRQVCEAMQFVHRNNILHLDLKPENILCLTKEGNRIKIIDFGLARRYDPDKKLQVLFGTPEFVAPEVVNFDSISFGTDMWSVGVICYVLLSGLSPFMGETDIETMANVTIAKYDFDDEAFHNVTQEALDFITKLLVKDISGRMTATECLEHKWLKRRPKPAVPPKPTVTIQPTKPLVAPIVKDTTPPPQTPPTPQLAPVPQIIETQDDSEVKELETTKDNLKSFIERWEEHPNSPYIFDNETNFIAPIRDVSADSVMSSRVCSPSPCESISSLGSTTEEIQTQKDDGSSTASEKLELENDIVEDGSRTPELLENKDFKHYLHSFDRRNSDTSYILGQRNGAEKLNLAEEIKKLSDHLLMLSEINTKLEKENSEMETTTAKPNESTTKRLDSIDEDKSTETPVKLVATTAAKIVPEKPKDLAVEKPKTTNSGTFRTTPNSLLSPTTLKAPTFKRAHEMFSRSASLDQSHTHFGSTLHKTTSVIKSSATTQGTTKTASSLTTTTTSSFSSSRTSGGHTKTTVTSERWQSSTETPRANGRSDDRSWSAEKSAKLLNGFKSITPANKIQTRASTEATGFGVPWPITNKRTKFRINQMSRDVPIGSPDTHQPFNLEDAANTTKDCLLHLLEKYNNTKLRSGPGGRHQSISVDWNVSDNLEYRSMSSINAFFQRHTSSGRNVKQLLTQLETKSKR